MIAYNSKIITNGLVLCLDAANPKSYPGSGTTWYDLSGNGNHGTLVNGVGYSTNNKGGMSFDGSDDYITLGNKFRYQDNFTVETICRFISVPNNPGAACGARHPIVYNHDYGYNLLIDGSGILRWNIYDTVLSSVYLGSTNQVVGNNFFYGVGTKSGTLVSLYLNGLLQSSSNLTTNAVYYTGSPFVIGGFATCGPNRFYATGDISITKVYNRALSAAEIAQNFAATRGRYGI